MQRDPKAKTSRDHRPPWLRAVAAALIVSALREANAGLDPKADGAVRLQSLDALGWLAEEDQEDALSFDTVCEVLGLPADRLRPRALGLARFIGETLAESKAAGGKAARPRDPDRPLSKRRRIRLLERILESCDPRGLRLDSRFDFEDACRRLGIDPGGEDAIAEQARAMLDEITAKGKPR
jgi:hypothetical protein